MYSEIAKIGPCRSWEEVEDSEKREIEDNRMNNLLMRDILGNIGIPKEERD